MSDQDASEIQFSKAELMLRIRKAFAELEETIQPLSPEELSRPGPSGWAIKDHLAHLAAWELGIAELLQRRDRFAAMGIQEAIDQGLGEDDINEQIYRRHAGFSSAAAAQMFYEAHHQMLKALDPLTDEELQQPYASFLTGSVKPGYDKPVWHWIVGNTNGHFEEHTGYIRELLAASAED